MNEIIKAIEEASIEIPYEWASRPTESGIPYAYTQGFLAGRQQAINLILSIKKKAPSEEGALPRS